MASGTRVFECFECGKKWDEPYGTGRPTTCPACGSRNIRRSMDDKGRRGAGRGCRQAPMRGGDGNG